MRQVTHLLTVCLWSPIRVFFRCSHSTAKPPSPLSSVQKEGFSHRCSPAALIPLPDSSTILMWHVSGSPEICLLLERMGCLKKECILKGFLLMRNQIKQKKKGNTLSWLCFFHIIRFTFSIGCADVPSMGYDESLPFQYDLKYQGKKRYKSKLVGMKQDLMPHYLLVTKHLEII